MGGIFVNYRRRDTEYIAGRLREDLSRHFGDEFLIFRDVDSMSLGSFPEEIAQAVSSCDAMVVVIGDNWLDARDAAGQRRIDQPDDWVRQEIATALTQDKIVVPVLVEGARLPTAEELPEDLKSLVMRQAVELPDSRWEYEVHRLVQKLENALARDAPTSTPTPTPPGPPARAQTTTGRVSKSAKLGIGLSVAGVTVTFSLVLGMAGSPSTNIAGAPTNTSRITATSRTTTPTTSTSATTQLPAGPWSATNGSLTLTVERIETASRSLRVHLLVDNRTEDSLSLYAQRFTLIDDHGRSYAVDPFSSDWREEVPPGKVRGVIDVEEPLQPGVTSLRAGWGIIYGGNGKGIFVDGIQVR